MDPVKKFIIFAVLFAAAFFGWQAIQNAPIAPPIESDDFTGWQSVEGRVTNLEIERPGHGRPSELTIFYEYEVGGDSYQFQTLLRFSDEVGADLMMQKYPKGKPIKVAYDPKKPKRSYVIRPGSMSYVGR